MYRVTLTHYPNEETRCVYTLLPPAKDPFREPELTPCQSESFDAESETNQNVLVNSPPLTLGPNSKPVENCFGKPSSPGWGDIPRFTQFGLNAKRTIMRCGGTLDKMVGHPSEVVFLTGTIPNGYDDGRITASAYSSWLLHSLKAWVNKYAKSKLDFYVWEYQRRGSLHLHYCVWVPCPIARGKILRRFRDEWLKLLLRLSEATGVDMCYSSPNGSSKDKTECIQAYAQEVRSSCTAYLAKYCSKSVEVARNMGGRVCLPPTRWWGCSRPLLAALRRGTVHHELTTMSRRHAQVKYEDVSTLLHSTSDVCHSYNDKVGRASITVAYQTAITGLNQCQMLMEDTKMSTQSRNGQTTSASVITSLRAIIRTSGLAPVNYAQGYTPYSEKALNELNNSESPSIIAVMEVLVATQYLLWSMYRNRNNKPVWLGRAEKRMQHSLGWIQTRRLEKNPSILLPLHSLD